jgi:hypothetical protein
MRDASTRVRGNSVPDPGLPKTVGFRALRELAV